MKKTLLTIGVVLCMTLVAHATASYTFTGYCDGFTVTVNSNKLALGYHLNNDCAGSKSIMSGVKGLVAITPETKNTMAVEWSDEDYLFPRFHNTGFWVTDTVHLTWALYGDNGSGSIQVLNYGTLTLGAPQVGGVGLKSAAAAAAANMPAVYTFVGIPGVYTFTFTGYCDGMTVTVSGLLAEGTHTGCDSGVVSGSLVTALVKPPETVSSPLFPLHDTVLVYNDGWLTGFYVIDLNRATWALYGDTGSGLKLVNSGTLTNGAPDVMKNVGSKPSFQP